MSKKVQNSHQSAQREDRSSESRSRSRPRSREKQRFRGTAHVGRPAKRQLFRRRESSPPPSERDPESGVQQLSKELGSIHDKPEIIIMQELIQFYHDIDQGKGLVGTETERKEIMRQALKDPQLARINWTPQHQWNPEKQKEKLLKCGKQFCLNLAENNHARIYSIIIGVSPIFAQQFTEEIYQIMLKVYLILTEETIPENSRCQLKYEGDKGEINDYFIDDDGNLKENFSQQSINQRQIQISDQNQKERSLIDLASAIAENRNGEYYFLSFNFKKTKSRSASQKKTVSASDRGKAYQKLILSIYQVMKNDASKSSIQN